MPIPRRHRHADFPPFALAVRLPSLLLMHNSQSQHWQVQIIILLLRHPLITQAQKMGPLIHNVNSRTQLSYMYKLNFKMSWGECYSILSPLCDFAKSHSSCSFFCSALTLIFLILISLSLSPCLSFNMNQFVIYRRRRCTCHCHHHNCPCGRCENNTTR